MVCSNCGKCCSYIIKGTEKICKYLQYNKDNTTFCPIYETRIGTIIDSKIIIKNYRNIKGKNISKNIVCGYRKDKGHDRYIKGCTEI